MTGTGTRQKWKRWVLGIGLVIVALPLIPMVILSSGAADNYFRRTIVTQIKN